jgi:hypothetical protein
LQVQSSQHLLDYLLFAVLFILHRLHLINKSPLMREQRHDIDKVLCRRLVKVGKCASNGFAVDCQDFSGAALAHTGAPIARTVAPTLQNSGFPRFFAMLSKTENQHLG